VKQEGWLSPTERASVSATSLRHIIWLPHESHAGMSLPSAVRQVQALGYVESLRHILASPGYAPGSIAVNVTWIEREFNACQTNCSMYLSIFNCFPVIQHVSLKFCHFSTFFAHFGLPGYTPGTIVVNVTWIERIQCWSKASQHIPIYLQPFLKYSDISVASD